MAVADTEEANLYQRLRAGDPLAPSDLCVAYLDTLAAWLMACHPNVHPNDCETAAADALLSLIKNPASYKPELRGLRGYLQMAATGDLRNALDRTRRQSGRNVSLEVVELSSEAGKLAQEDADPADIVARREGEAPMAVGLPTLPDAVKAAFNREEQAVRRLMWLGERSTAKYAAALNILDQPVEEQRLEVKRVKDRVKKRLQRAGISDV
ncbi:MAG TPA: hypothetical protein VGP33_05235 [Chloroflexota bacterium]|jgi:RNA polymerase sigma-70 factor (ECF subfamily)|nr:hypothetical protein [Chloroflexota bacterium]